MLSNILCDLVEVATPYTLLSLEHMLRIIGNDYVGIIGIGNYFGGHHLEEIKRIDNGRCLEVLKNV